MNDHNRTLDLAGGISAAVAAVTFWQGIALALTILAALVSIVCGVVRLHDRLKYGPGQ